MRSQSTKSKGITFEEWLRKVENVVENRIGMSIHDLEDYDFQNSYEEDQTPSECADGLIEDQELEEPEDEDIEEIMELD